MQQKQQHTQQKGQQQRPPSLIPAVFAALVAVTASVQVLAQENRAVNGIADNRQNAYALTNATIYLGSDETLANATLLMRDARIVDVGTAELPTTGYFVIDLKGHYIYPGFIDMYSTYGIPELEREDGEPGVENLYANDLALNVNDAIRANFRASDAFSPQEEVRDEFRKLGFSTVLALRADGIARGTSALITLGDERANEAIIVPDVAAHYSLSKGTSIQSMPSSLMGAFALLRQTYLDAQWFDLQQPRPFTDATLEAWNRIQSLPQIMDVANWQQALTADRIGDEFSAQYILKTSGDSYRRTDPIKNTGATLIIPVDFPEAPAVLDVFEADDIAFDELKHWELAPFNPRVLAEQEIPFAITSNNAHKDFWKNLRAAVSNGLPESVAINALTRVPAQLLNAEDLVGQLTPGAYANLLISSGPLFAEDSVLLENWIQGQPYKLSDDFDDRGGNYVLTIAAQNYALELSFKEGKPEATVKSGESEADGKKADLELADAVISLSFVFDESGNRVRLTGWTETGGWRGNGRLPDGALVDWSLQRDTAEEALAVATESAPEVPDLPSTVNYPFSAYGRETIPEQQDTLIQGAMVWTNEDAGNLVTDVLLRDGRIAAIGTNLDAGNARVVDGTGKHLTPGIIDEHSHIALFAINEGQTNSSMVRMKDVVDSENINIYRNLAGGVTAAQLLHGSANPIGGQSALIKMRWGRSPQELLIEDADEFIKFALGENVKRSSNPASVRYPQTRMGVEQVFMDAFSQAQEYGKAWDTYNSLSRAEQRTAVSPRRDLVKETMLEILNGERYVTSHSYVQSEINMLMHVADSFDFNINTFTHILEGYKVADKIAQHGAGGSTFADWFGYKWEVRYAIPYNAALMQQAGVVVAINSDDAEMSRRLNQEAAKTVKYGEVSEIDALKMVTLNPAKLLHLDARMGSIRQDKDADVVLWSDHPLSIYAVVETTWVDGIPYFDRKEDLLLREQIAAERARIIAAISKEKPEAASSEQDTGEVR